jgi:hypothetical protein
VSDELSATARALLEATRQELTPDAAAIARVRGKLDTAILGGAAGMTLATKLGLLGLVAAVGVGTAIVATRGDDRPIEVAVVAPAPVVQPPPAIVVESPPPPMAPPIVVEKTVVQPKRKVIKATLAREVELVDRAMIALRANDPVTALAAVRSHALETANAGQLAEDIGAIEIEALCMQHAPAADGKLAAFDQRWPSSAQRERLIRACR